MSHKEYQLKDPDMPDCTICLINFTPEDEIVVFSCDAKHYFHKTCGLEWLEAKTECPLCRFDFSNEIQEFIAKNNDDIVENVAREAASTN